MSKLTLDRILQSQGIGTRKQCRELIANGDVCIAGAVFTDTKALMETDGLTFTVFGQLWEYRKQVYIALNKPADFECSRKPSHHPSVLTLLPEELIRRGVQPVGRLDHDTTGLLLLSDDGAFNHVMSSPKHHVPKTYLVETYDPVTPKLIELLLNGVQLHHEALPLAAKSCRMLDEYHVEIVLDEGKYHQVKRMLAAAGNHCVSLQRLQIGDLKLDDLELNPGEWCYLDSQAPILF